MNWLLARQPEYRIGIQLWVRGLALVYLLAFLSLAVQIQGLGGEKGILPLAHHFGLLEEQLGHKPWWALPSVFWWWNSDTALVGAAVFGALVSLVALLGFASGICLSLAWLLYLSYASLARAQFVFLGFQWDALLVETGFLALWVAPWRLREGRALPPRRLALWLVYLLLFRLMFASGYVKLASGDPSWTELWALTVHYETQPLPTAFSWYAYQLPLPWQKLCCAAMFFIELVVPFLMLVPGRLLRRLAGLLLIGLQVAILVTGNYGFFNLLTLVLCLPLLDDSLWRRVARRCRTSPQVEPVNTSGGARLASWLWVLMVLALTGHGALRFALQMPVSRHLPVRVLKPFDYSSAWMISNTYGLFARMTHERWEIVVQGSEDGKIWEAYRFRYQPGDLTRAPVWAQPHMPRLDWQMWFAALQPRPPFWFQRFIARLLQGEATVLALLADDSPFRDHPPRFVRANRRLYRFTDPETRARTGQWWTRGPAQAYLPVQSRAP